MQLAADYGISAAAQRWTRRAWAGLGLRLTGLALGQRYAGHLGPDRLDLAAALGAALPRLLLDPGGRNFVWVARRGAPGITVLPTDRLDGPAAAGLARVERLSDLAGPAAADGAWRTVEAALGRFSPFEAVEVPFAGRGCWQASAAVLRDGAGRATGLVGVLADVSEARLAAAAMIAEAAAARDRHHALLAMLGDLATDLRGLFAAVAEGAGPDSGDGPGEAARRGLDIAGRLRDLAALEAGSLHLVEQDVDLRELVDAVAAARAGAGRPNAGIVASLPARPRLIRGDLRRLHQALAGVVAAAAAAAGDRPLELRLEEADDGGLAVVIGDPGAAIAGRPPPLAVEVARRLLGLHGIAVAPAPGAVRLAVPAARILD